MFPFKYPRTSQPQGAVQINRVGIGRSIRCLIGVGTKTDIVTPGRVITYGAGTTIAPTDDGLAWAESNTTTAGILFGSGGWSTVVQVTEPITFYVRAYVGSLGTRNVLLGDWSAAGTNESFCFETTVGNQWQIFAGTAGSNGAGGTVTVGWHNFVITQYPNRSVNAWVDGVLVVSYTGTGARVAGSNAAFLAPGAYTGGLGWGSKATLLAIGNEAASNVVATAFHANPRQLFAPVTRPIWAAPSTTVVSISRPNSDVTTTGWTGNPDNVTLFTNINEVSPNNSTFIESPAITGTGDPTVFDFLPTKPAGTWDVSVIAQFTGSSADVRVIMMDASDTVQGTSAWQTVTSTWVTYPISVTTTGTSSRVKVEVR